MMTRTFPSAPRGEHDSTTDFFLAVMRNPPKIHHKGTNTIHLAVHPIKNRRGQQRNLVRGVDRLTGVVYSGRVRWLILHIHPYCRRCL